MEERDLPSGTQLLKATSLSSLGNRFIRPLPSKILPSSGPSQWPVFTARARAGTARSLSGVSWSLASSTASEGEIQLLRLLILTFPCLSGSLDISIKQCRDLAPVDTKRNRSDPYVKVYLLPDRSKAGKRKTKVKKHTLNPVFEEIIKFVMPLGEVERRTMWISVWHR